MATTNRPTEAGAIGTRPSQSPAYSSRGVFESGGQDTEGQITNTSVDTGGGALGETRLTPSFSGGGAGANDSTITLNAGDGIDGGGSFTTNQANNETINFNLPDTFVPMTGQTAGSPIGTADNPIQSITVDQFGRVESVTIQTAIPQPTPFMDQFSSSEDRTPRAASTIPRMEDITLMVEDGYTIGTPMLTSTGDVPVTIGTPTGVGTNMVTIPVTIPATTQASDPVGTAMVSSTTTVTETDTGRTREETSTPIDVPVFIPFYQGVFNDRRTMTVNLSSLTESTAALTSGTMVSFSYDSSGPRRQYAYLALEDVTGRNYRFDAGFFDISADALSMTATMFGRRYNFYEFPTQADLSFTIRF